MKNSKISQRQFIMNYFIANPGRDIEHKEAVDYLTSEYEKTTGEKFRDVDRGIRKLSQEGNLIKVRKGVYRYDPDMVIIKDLEDFTEKQKKEILERDGYRCVICGKGLKDGVELQVDHIKPKQLGGKAEIANGQTLCAPHNFKKKHYNQTETGKKMFMQLYELSKVNKDEETAKFCEEILGIFEKHNINGHIVWKK